MEPSGAGQVIPAGVFFDEQTKETTAVTFTTWRDIEKGEALHLAAQGGISLFHVAGLWGTIETDFPSFPVQLTWSSLPATAQRLLSESGCGEEATTLILRNGTYPESLLRCLRIA